MKHKRPVLITIIFAVFFALNLSIAPTATAGDDMACAMYAKKAVEQNKENINYGCGLKGPEWNPNYQDHFNWCMRGENSKHTYDATNDRSASLINCKRFKESPCSSYASKAFDQGKENINNGCGFKGPAWNTNYKDHYNWCMRGENIKLTDKENRARQAKLDTCSEAGLDLYIKDITVIPANPAPNTRITVKTKFWFTSPMPYQNKVWYYMDANIIVNPSATVIKPGENISEVSFTLPEGKHSITAMVDPQRQITETNESNNSKTIFLGKPLSKAIKTKEKKIGGPKTKTDMSLPGEFTDKKIKVTHPLSAFPLGIESFFLVMWKYWEGIKYKKVMVELVCNNSMTGDTKYITLSPSGGVPINSNRFQWFIKEKTCWTSDKELHSFFNFNIRVRPDFPGKWDPSLVGVSETFKIKRILY